MTDNQKGALCVGIDQIGVYLPRYVQSLDELADARGIPREKISVGLGCQKMAVAPPWEDSVVLGANAAARLFAQGTVRREEIGMLLLGTETAVDHAKAASIFLHDLLELPSNCRTFELKHACYGGTAGLMMAADWVRSGRARGRKALVVATDIARYDVGSSAEFTQGAGAVAMVVGENPRLLELEPVSGVFASNVYDFWRPLDRREALVDGKFSLDCYLNALEGAATDFRSGLNGSGGAPLLSAFGSVLYHTPFPKMAYKAHMRLVEHEWKRLGRDARELPAAAEKSYAEMVDPSLGAARLVGNTYTASLYLCLAWLAERGGEQIEGKRIGMFSYGSGCCAEFFAGRFVAGSAKAAASRIGLEAMLAARRELSVEEYEGFTRKDSCGGMPPGEDAGFCYFAGIENQKRVYRRSDAHGA